MNCYTKPWASKATAKVYIHSGKDNSVLHTATGAIEQDALGVDGLSVGDVNADGAIDYMLTAVGQDFGGVAVGHVYIITFQAKPAMTLQPALVGCQPIQAE